MDGATIKTLDIILTSDIFLKNMTVIGKVKIVALTVEQTRGITYFKNFLTILEFIDFIFSLKNLSILGSSKIIPKVELTESSSPISPPEKGLVRHIQKIAKPSEFKESAFFKKAFPKR